LGVKKGKEKGKGARLEGVGTYTAKGVILRRLKGEALNEKRREVYLQGGGWGGG